MPARSRINGPDTVLPPPPPPQQGPASQSAGRGKRQSRQPASANPLFPPATNAGRGKPSKHSHAPSNPFANLPPPPEDKSSGIDLPSPPLYKGDGMPLHAPPPPPPPSQGVAYPPRITRAGDRPPAPAGNIRIVPLPAGFIPPSAKQGAPKNANGRRNKRNNRPPSIGAPFMHAFPAPPQGKPQPHTHQRPEPTSGITQDEIHWEGIDDSFYGALPVSHKPAPRKAVHHGHPAARRQSSIASSSFSAASDNSFASGLTDHTILDEKLFVDFVGNDINESLIKVSTKKSPRTGTSTQINIDPLPFGKIHHTVSRLIPKSKGRRAPF